MGFAAHVFHRIVICREAVLLWVVPHILNRLQDRFWAAGTLPSTVVGTSGHPPHIRRVLEALISRRLDHLHPARVGDDPSRHFVHRAPLEVCELEVARQWIRGCNADRVMVHGALHAAGVEDPSPAHAARQSSSGLHELACTLFHRHYASSPAHSSIRFHARHKASTVGRSRVSKSA
eukprot:391238-Prymnesium_polylepis.1